MILHDPGFTYASATAAALWLGLLALPWQPWRARERLEAAGATPDADLSSIVVLIPARNEAATIGHTLTALAAQGRNLKTILIDDQSSDGTVDAARRAAGTGLTIEIVSGATLEPGWAGKMFALEQGRARADRPLILLLDADIALEPGTIAALLEKQRETGAALVSLMAELSMQGWAERLLMPAFVYFFKLVYPFALSNRPTGLVAAAAGGCVLIERAALDGIGGFGTLKGAIIDDCALACTVKRSGRRTWIGLSHAAKSIRSYQTLGTIWRMVARSAYTQLHYSPVLLGLASLMLALAFWMPLVALAAFPVLDAKLIGGLALLAMMASYLPTLLYYRRSPLWALALPLIGTLYLAMTWSSTLDYWRGSRTVWKGRTYDRGMHARGP